MKFFSITPLLSAALIIGYISTTKITLADGEKKEGSSKSDTSINDASRVVAELKDGTKITLGDVQKALMTLPVELRNAPFSKIYEALLYRLVDTELLYKAAVQQGVDKDPKVLKSAQAAEEAIAQKALLDSLIDQKATLEELRKKFDEVITTFDKNEKEIQVRQITCKSKEDAEKILKDLKAGRKKFDDFLRLSVDEPSRKKKGDIGFIRKNDVPKTFWEALFKTEEGKIVEKPQKIGQFYLVCKIEKKRTVEPPKFDDEGVQETVKKSMQSEFAVQVIKDIRNAARKKGLKLIGLDKKPLKDEDLEPKKDKNNEKQKKSSVDISKLDPEMVVATLPNKEEITLKQVQESQSTLPEQLRGTNFGDLFLALLLRTVDMKLISAEVERGGFHDDPKVKQRRAEVRKLTIQKAYVDRIVRKKMNKGMIKDSYEEILRTLPKDEREVRLRMIIIKDKEKAHSLYKDIKSGKKKFDDAVSESEDEQTRKNKGDLGYVRRNELPSALATIVFKAAKATLLPEVVDLGEAGYAIIRVEDKQIIPPPSLRELAPNIERQLSAKIATEHLEKLREGVRLYDLDGKLMKLKKTAKGEEEVKDSSSDRKPIKPIITNDASATAAAAA